MVSLCLSVYVPACPGDCKTCTYDGGSVRCIQGGCDSSSYFDNSTGTCVCMWLISSHFIRDIHGRSQGRRRDAPVSRLEFQANLLTLRLCGLNILLLRAQCLKIQLPDEGSKFSLERLNLLPTRHPFNMPHLKIT